MDGPPPTPHAEPNRPPVQAWFVWLAPVTVPAYLLYLAGATVLAGCHYITIDQTLARLMGRPVCLGGAKFAIAALLFVPLTPFAVAVHVLIWAIRQFGRLLVTIGSWQTGMAKGEPAVQHASSSHQLGSFARWAAGAFGAIWLVSFIWCVVAGIDPVGGMWLLGKPVPGAEETEKALRSRMTLGQLSAESRARRAALIESTRAGGANSDPRSAELLPMYVERDDELFGMLPTSLQRRLVGMPWWYHLGINADDVPSHGTMLIGALMITILLMIRWPGLHRPAWPRAATVALFVIRVGVALATVAWAFTWMPMRVNFEPPSSEAWWFRVGCPATWIGLDPMDMIPPQWNPLNAALWLMIAGLAALIWSAAARLRPWLGAPGYYTSYLAVRLLQRKRIAFFSIGAVTLCVAMELIVISVMGGFLDTIRERSHSIVGDLAMDAGLTGFPRYQEFIDQVRQWPEVHAVTPVIHSYGVLRFDATGLTKAVEVRGIRLDEYREVNNFADPARDGLYYDKYYPGTTTLAASSQPLYGFDMEDKPVLPEPFESAWQRYLAGLSPTERERTLTRWGRVARSRFSGPGVFDMAQDLRPAASAPAFAGAILGRDLMGRRLASGEYDRSEQCPRGARITLTLLPVSRSGSVSNDAPPKPQLRYVDDSRTGVYEIDSRTVYVDFDYLQYLLDMTPLPMESGGKTLARCTSIKIRLKPGRDLAVMRRRVLDAWRKHVDETPETVSNEDFRAMANVDVSTWEELQAGFIEAIQKEKVLTVIMFGIISVVAVLLVLCIFYMIVVEKTRDIGIIKSVGGSAQGVAAVFLTYGAAIGVVGAAFGSLLGATFVKHINSVQDWLARMNPAWRVWSPEQYSFDKIPDTVKTEEMLWIAGLAVVASILGAVVPALRAARTWPVEALRYE